MNLPEATSSRLEPPVEPVVVMGVPVHPITIEQLHAWIEQRIGARARALVLHVNVHGLNLAHELPWLREAFTRSELVFCDGAGVMLAVKLLGKRIPERITYADWLPRFAAHCAARGHTLYLLGGRPGVAEAAARSLSTRFVGLRVVGTHHGYFDHDPRSEGCQRVVESINLADPDVLLVAFGMPLQERWLVQLWPRLDARIGLTAGAALDYAAGNLSRGPSILVDNGFEWLARMIIEPRRLWRRYLIGNPLFAARFVRSLVRGPR